MKNGTHIIELYANSFGTQFQNNIDIFSCALAEKSGKDDGVSFLTLARFLYFATSPSGGGGGWCDTPGVWKLSV